MVFSLFSWRVGVDAFAQLDGAPRMPNGF